MKPDDFQRIEKHLLERGLDKGAAQFAFSKYIESVGDAIKRSEKDKNRSLTSEEEREICENFLGVPSLETYYQLAHANRETEQNRRLSQRSFGDKLKKFVATTAINLFSAFLFIIILVLFYAVAKDQVISLLRTLGVEESSEAGPRGLMGSEPGTIRDE